MKDSITFINDIIGHMYHIDTSLNLALSEAVVHEMIHSA